MSGFTKLFSSITSSSIWNEDDKTRIVWITMLALCDPDGVVRASVGGLAHTARVSRADCDSALSVLESPDADSRSPEHEGRRIQRINGGFLLLNYGKYREARSEDERRAYMREYMQSYRKKTVNKSKQTLAEVSRSEPPLAQEEAEEKQKENTNTGELVSVPPKEWQPTEQMKRINFIMGRRDSTKWSQSEVKALRSLGDIPDDDYAAVVKYYKAQHPPAADYRRKDLGTLLNNWSGEVDRARRFKPSTCF